MLFALGMARADEPHSPRLDALTKKLASHERGAEEAFWRQVAADGTPIIEDAHEPGHLLVSFVWRGSATTKRVQLIGPVDPPQPEADLERIPGSNTFATTLSLPDTGRFIYSFMIDGDKNTRFSPDRVRIDPVQQARL